MGAMHHSEGCTSPPIQSRALFVLLLTVDAMFFQSIVMWDQTTSTCWVAGVTLYLPWYLSRTLPSTAPSHYDILLPHSSNSSVDMFTNSTPYILVLEIVDLPARVKVYSFWLRAVSGGREYTLSACYIVHVNMMLLAFATLSSRSDQKSQLWPGQFCCCSISNSICLSFYRLWKAVHEGRDITRRTWLYLSWWVLFLVMSGILSITFS